MAHYRDLHSQALCLLGTVPTPISVLARDLGVRTSEAREVCEQLMARGFPIILGVVGPRKVWAQWHTVAVTPAGMAMVRREAEAYLKGREP